MEKKREVWVDNTKVIACVLVATGHFFMSMVTANILPNAELYQWFRQTIYYFHVQLFFICSGYLYQKSSVVNSFCSWQSNIKKKIVNLGVPYFTFSLITWLLKTAFSGSVNTQIGGSLFEMLFLHPTAPYWYLYALFFLFLVTPTLSSKVETVVALIIALLFKAFEVFGGGCGIQAISYILSNEIWFVIGMCLSVFDFRSYMVKKRLGIPILLGIGFLILSVFVYVMDINFSGMGFFLGLSACCAVIAIVEERYKKNKQSLMFGILAKYTMPIFLMHTIFAAGLRMILLKIGIQNALIHIVLGLSISFAGPMAAAIVMKKSKWLEFFIYPSKFIKIK